MAVSRAARLAPVVDMAESAERAAVQRLGHFQGQVRIAEGKLNDLEQFRLDYQQQWIDKGAHGVSGQWLLGYQRFLTQLDTAVDQQRRSLAWHQD
ncbi:flagellar export protein FliJ, partial [Pseudomonas quasicaspiana]|nr:flagellar export protein FliJ [Pseudomonas quasicaspiana]